ncbi:MAG: hypothetical protein G01um10145_472 [Microgenomates group bacterium Gr01-1014_5]|nr:MAG: hypothetical protein G01um10145_472 [Microgenomates group bacterium Gr01-1014_5]
MIFTYRRVTSQLGRPVIPIILKSRQKFILGSALIDSGSDCCVFNTQTAKILSVGLSSKSRTIKGIGSELVNGKWGALIIKVAGKSYKIKALFVDTVDVSQGILGTKGFFDHFDVKLSYRKRVIEILPALRVS